MSTITLFQLLVALPLWTAATGVSAWMPLRQPDVLQERLHDYLVVRDQAVRDVGPVPVTRSARELVAANRAIASRIQDLRRNTTEGTILGPPVRDDIRSTIRTRLSRKDQDALLARIEDVQPDAATLRVNGRYPDSQPIPSTPAALLRVLPPLPPVLTWRLVGRDLVLLDNTGVIIDVLRGVLPVA